MTRSLRYLYFLLFFITPLIFTSSNSELFELPKMYFVYSITLVILILHLINYFRGQTTLFRHTFLDFPLVFFLISQIASTIFSIDVHTSIFGYYSRLNGGLLSLLAYSFLYWVLVVYLDEKLKSQLIISTLISGFLIAAFGIAEHFGIDKNIWVQDVQARVFSTFGQPNWLAAYLCILLPLSLYCLVDSKTRLSKFLYSLTTLSFYLCLLYTKSKSGIIAGIIAVSVFYFFYFVKNISSNSFLKNRLFVGILLTLVTLSLTIPNPIKDIFFPPAPSAIAVPTTLNITPSEDIRKIVWQGSLKLWQQFPLFGTGPETFGYTYYWTRPASHNLTSEWDFLYNKAHNEYLNYLATTGSFGIVTYALLIATVVTTLTLAAFNSSSLLVAALLASYVSILVSNFAGFSVVSISVFFYLRPAFYLPPAKPQPQNPPILLKAASLALVLLLTLLSMKNLFFYLADITYTAADSFDSNQKYSSAFDQILLSLQYRPDEPVYLSKAADITAKLAIISKSDTDTSLTQKYTALSLKYLDQAAAISPFSVNFWKEKAQTCYYLSVVNSKYYLLALDALTKATKLAPTDAKSFYMLGQFYQNVGQIDEATKNFQQALVLKSNYDYAYFALGKIYLDQKKYDLAAANFNSTLKIAPNNTDAQDYLAFIATQSASKNK